MQANKMKMTQKTAVRVLCRLAAFCVLLPASGASYYVQSGKTDFSKTDTYLVDGVEPESLPTSTDLVYLPSGAKIEVKAPSESFSTIASVKRIVPQGGGSLAVNVTNAESVCEMSSAFALATTAESSDYLYGTLIKRGEGTLSLSGTALVTSTQKYDYSYFANITAEDGVLKLPTYEEPSPTHYIGILAVSNGASVFFPPTSNCELRGLYGDGVLTNSSSTAVSVEIRARWSGCNDGVGFSGEIGGKVALNSNGVGSLTGTNSTFSGDMTVNHRRETSGGAVPASRHVLGVKKFGMAGEPSSIGTSASVFAGFAGGRFKYLGTGETTDKSFKIQNWALAGATAAPFEIDGGTTGGLVLEGGEIVSVYANTSDNALVRMLLTGSHTNACVIADPYKGYSSNFPLHLKKTGTGRWELRRGAKNATNTGAVTIERGELGYDSLAAKGSACVFGYATDLYQYMSTALASATRTPYAFTLGSATTTGTLDYVGTNRVSGSGRLVGLAGTGRFTTSGANRSEVFFSGVSAIGDGAARTLILDGATGVNTFANITNGEGVVSVVKCGAGTWVIEQETSFSGSLRVEGGTLTVRAPDAPYTWHRMTIKSTWGSGFPSLKEFAMYNTSGARCNKGLVCDHILNRADPSSSFDIRITPKKNAMELDPGHATFSDGRTHKVGYTSENLVSVFDDDSSTRWFEYKVGDNGNYPVEGTSARWIKFTMRQKADAGEVVAYDMVETHSTKSGAYTYPIKAYMIEASQNGVVWTTLTNTTFGIWNEDTGTYTDPTSTLTANKWYSSFATFAANRVLGENEGFRIPGRPTWNGPAALANVSSVSVVSNAVLEAEGDVALGALKIDASSGGTIRGVSLKATGSIEVVNLPKAGSGMFEMPIVFEDVTGLENLSAWSFTVEGRPRPADSFRVADGKLYYFAPGAMIIIR